MVAHFLLALVEFFLINWVGKHSITGGYGYHQISFIQTTEESPLFNVAFRVLGPTVFLVITAAIWYSLGLDEIVRNYWRVTAFYFVIRWGFNIALGRAGLMRWGNQLLIAALAIGLSIIVSEQLLVDRAAVMPSARGLTDELWIVVIAFLYLTVSRIGWTQLGSTFEEKKRDYVLNRYRHFNSRFGSAVAQTARNRAAEALSYSIMIYESFNRPFLFQLIENWLLFPIGHAKSLGPMQVATTIRLPRAGLVRIGVERVNVAFAQALQELKSEEPTALSNPDHFESVSSDMQMRLITLAAGKYNIRSDYPGQVEGIFSILREVYYKDLVPKE